MKIFTPHKALILGFLILLSFTAVAQVTKTLNLTTAGTLSTTLTSTEKTTITNLTLTGKIDARDFKCMRDEMTQLSVLDLSGTAIQSCVGIGPYPFFESYNANEIPLFSFCNYNYVGHSGKASLTSVKLPATVTSIGDFAFHKCINLKGTLIIPNTVTSIGISAFSYCSSLNGLLLSNTLTIIGEESFYNCSSLTGSLLIPNTVTDIGNNAFANNSALQGLTLSNSLTSIEAQTFYNCSSLTGTLVIPNSVTSIGNGSFSNCTQLDSLKVSSSLSNIGSSTFSGCNGLVVECLGNTPPSGSPLDFNGIVFVPQGTLAAYQTAWGWTSTSTTFLIEKGKEVSVNVNVTEPGKLATTIFTKFGIHPGTVNKLTVTGTLSDADIYYIRDNMKQCYSVDISGVNITSLPNDAFNGKWCLFNILLPSGLKTIGSSAFSGCNGLMTISLPSVTSIGDQAFYSCKRLNTISLPAVTSINSSVFSHCSGLTTLFIPSVTTINSWAFTYCRALTTLIFQSKLNTIGEYAFYGCSKVTEITSYRITPAILGTNAFNGINPQTCKLRILKDADFDAYFSAPQWGSFLNVEFIDLTGKMGDSNEDGTVNVLDVVNVVNYILEKPVTTFNSLYSDTNKDGAINVIDVVGVVNLITATPTLRSTKAISPTADYTFENGVFTAQSTEGIRAFDFAYTGTFNTLPALNGFSAVMYQKNGQQRILAYTMGDAIAKDGMTQLFYIAGGEISDLMFVSDAGSTLTMEYKVATNMDVPLVKNPLLVHSNEVKWVGQHEKLVRLSLYSSNGALITTTTEPQVVLPNAGIYLVKVESDKRSLQLKIAATK